MPPIINNFMGQYRFLSNFAYGKVTFEGLDYPTTEHAFQAAKTLDPAQRKIIQQAATPGEAKKLGGPKEKGGIVTLRPDWDSGEKDAQIRYIVMTYLVRQKFTNHPDLRRKLHATKDAILIEGNYWHDRVWGVCTCAKHTGEGTNWLGEILMNIRAELPELHSQHPF
jgi:ribA/ribD-fused uncharacterized protein